MSRWSNILAAGFIAVVACVLSYFAGAASVEPEVKVLTVTRVEHDIQYRDIEKPQIYTVEVPVEVVRYLPRAIKQFPSEEELVAYLASRKAARVVEVEFRGSQSVCVRSASFFQKQVIGDGWLVNFQAFDANGKRVEDHALNSTWAGDTLYFIEPQTYQYKAVCDSCGEIIKDTWHDVED